MVSARNGRGDVVVDAGERRSLPPFPSAPSLGPVPKVSIIVNNFNYAVYLPAAIDSALNQTYPNVEVIVVDDGSEDDSRAVIASYGDRVRAVLQSNQGQKAAFNTGLATCSGDIVIFLDADDLLELDTVARVVDVFTQDPSVVRVMYRLRVVDSAGRDTGARVPSGRNEFAQGDVRSKLLSFPDDLPWPPTTGNAFATWVLKELLPLEVDEDMTAADHDLHTLVPLFGPIEALDGFGGAYRIHGANNHARTGLDVVVARRILRRTALSNAALASRAALLGYPPAHPRSVTLAINRLVSLRLGGPGHPVPDDTRWRAARAGWDAARARWDVTATRRAEFRLWFVVAALAPRPVLRRLAERAFEFPPRAA